MQHIFDDHGLEDVQFVVAVGASHRDCNVVAHHLRGDHCDGFALSGIDLQMTVSEFSNASETTIANQ